MKTIKFLLIIIFSGIVFQLSAQINVINSTDGSMTITPKGIRGKLPTATAEDSTNISLGENALQNNINAKNNIAIGKNALKTLSFNNGGASYQSDNIAIGYEALMTTQPTSSPVFGNGNIAIGSKALRANTFYSDNIGIGKNALFNSRANRNISIGSFSLYSNTSGGNNIAIGHNAGYLNNGSRNVMIGFYSGADDTNVNDKLYISSGTTNEPLIKGDFSTGEVKINNKLRVGGTGDAASATLQVDGSFAISGAAVITSSANNYDLNGKSVIYVNGGGTYTLTGIAGGVQGRIIHIIVPENADLILANNSGLSLANNSIKTGSNADITISQGGGATLIYDTFNNDWRVIGFKN